MKLMNPSGRVPSLQDDIKAYACYCNVELNLRWNTFGTPTPNCSNCNCGCNPAVVDNQGANSAVAVKINNINM
ncbi:MAG: hypothetical protein LBC96_04715 [Lachnospiraceae bacterium]|jgi:hypothetical protein|nr:hypothetical protein [Lachnospiraceae bacterium]